MADGDANNYGKCACVDTYLCTHRPIQTKRSVPPHATKAHRPTHRTCHGIACSAPRHTYIQIAADTHCSISVTLSHCTARGDSRETCEPPLGLCRSSPSHPATTAKTLLREMAHNHLLGKCRSRGCLTRRFGRPPSAKEPSHTTVNHDRPQPSASS